MNHVFERTIPGRTTTNSSFASRQQKSMSSLMSDRQDTSSLTCSKSRELHTLLANRSWCPETWKSIYIYWLTDHYKHGSLWFAWACDCIDALQLFPANICTFFYNFDGFLEEFLLCVLQEVWNCSLTNKILWFSWCKSIFYYAQCQVLRGNRNAVIVTWTNVGGSDEISR